MHLRRGPMNIHDEVMNLDAQVRSVLARADAIVAAQQPARAKPMVKTAPVLSLQQVFTPAPRRTLLGVLASMLGS